ncbi:MAG: winged helix DNA-binding protein [Aeromicrobium sp.]|nr:winged helix DNA-binding protein [Aeromicrobium sp.]
MTAAARAVVALHGTDPASTVLSALARTEGAVPGDVERALYDDRTLVRLLSMRRTVFAVPRDLVGTCLAGASDVVAKEQRRLLGTMVAATQVSDDPTGWIERAEQLALAAVAAAGELTSAELSASDPVLATRLRVGTGEQAAGPTVASRLLLVLSAEGHVVRSRPRGGWTSTQYRWTTMDTWCDVGPVPEPDVAAAALAEAWLRAYGPATLDDLVWWAGWTKTRGRRAVASLDTAEVELACGPGLAMADDLDPVAPPDPWIALLPALDPSIMGWKHRDFVLGAHRERVFDTTGNAGPTIWVDGRVVGGWAQRDDGEVAVRVLDDVGTEVLCRIDGRAAELTQVLGDVRLKARARRWTQVETDLRG